MRYLTLISHLRHSSILRRSTDLHWTPSPVEDVSASTTIWQYYFTLSPLDGEECSLQVLFAR